MHLWLSKIFYFSKYALISVQEKRALHAGVPLVLVQNEKRRNGLTINQQKVEEKDTKAWADESR